MLAQSHARKPAPPLAARGMWLRLHGGPDAFGSALGDAVVGAITQKDQNRLGDGSSSAHPMVMDGTRDHVVWGKPAPELDPNVMARMSTIADRAPELTPEDEQRIREYQENSRLTPDEWLHATGAGAAGGTPSARELKQLAQKFGTWIGDVADDARFKVNDMLFGNGMEEARSQEAEYQRGRQVVAAKKAADGWLDQNLLCKPLPADVGSIQEWVPGATGRNGSLQDQAARSTADGILMFAGDAALAKGAEFAMRGFNLLRSADSLAMSELKAEFRLGASRGATNSYSMPALDGSLLLRDGVASASAPARAFYNGVEIDSRAAIINPELAEGFVGPVNPNKIFRRVESSSQSSGDLNLIANSGELWGNPNYNSGGVPTVSALRGPVPAGQKGVEFITAIPLGNSQNPRLNGQVNWGKTVSGDLPPGMTSFTNPKTGNAAVKMPIIVLRKVGF